MDGVNDAPRDFLQILEGLYIHGGRHESCEGFRFDPSSNRYFLRRGWTALQLVQQAHLEVNRAGLAGAPRVSAGPPEPFVAPMKRRSLSLFTGCGALDYALPWCSPVAYCERDPDAAAVLRARMLDGCLTSSYHPGSTPFAPPFAQGLSGVFADPQSAFIGKHKGLHFNSGRPSTKECMTTLSQYMQEYHRLKMLGNAVIPLQANIAARILSSLA